MEKLSDEQRQFAEEHHDLVYRYLASRELSIDAYYDVVVMGYLRAVQNYLTRPDLRQYEFSTIAYNCMRSAVGGAFRSQNALMRSGRGEVSLDQPVTDDFSRRLLHEAVPADERQVDDSILDRMAEEEYLSKLTPLQQRIARLSFAGYERQQIADACGISLNKLYGNLETMRALLCRNLSEIAA